MPLPSWVKATGRRQGSGIPLLQRRARLLDVRSRSVTNSVEENGVRYDGKRIRLKPFLVISTSRDGKNTKTITSDVAVIDLNQPLGFNVGPDGEPLKVKHVHLEPNVADSRQQGHTG